MARGRGPFAGGTEQARLQLIRAAESCFAEYGLSRTRIDDVAHRAGVSRPTVYRYFRDRDALVAAVLERRAGRFIERAREHVARFPKFADKVVEGLSYAVAAGREDAIIKRMIDPVSLNLATEMLTGNNMAQRLTDDLWRPILEEAQRSGEMRADLDPFDVSSWFCEIEMVLVGRQDLVDPEDRECRELLRGCVLPALVTG